MQRNPQDNLQSSGQKKPKENTHLHNDNRSGGVWLPKLWANGRSGNRACIPPALAAA